MNEIPRPFILIRGANDVGSAVAHALFRAGYACLLQEISQPTTARRGMSFTDAVFDGHAQLEGVTARRTSGAENLAGILSARREIPLSMEEISDLLANLRPQALIDARMRKHEQPEAQRGLAPLTIGLGPNFIAGQTVDFAIETGWGERLGKIVTHGSTANLEGEPRAIEGHARERYVYAPAAGIFRTSLKIGDAVWQGQEVAQIGEEILRAPIAGRLRGLTRDGVPARVKAKVIEIDPRETNPQIWGIGERPAKIAAGVLQVIARWLQS